jgi:hypothetical protein
VRLEGVLYEFFLNTWKNTADGSTDANSYAILARDWCETKSKIEAYMACREEV